MLPLPRDLPLPPPIAGAIDLGGMSCSRAYDLAVVRLWRWTQDTLSLRYRGSPKTARERSEHREIGHSLIDFADAVEAGLFDRFLAPKHRRPRSSATVSGLWRTFESFNHYGTRQLSDAGWRSLALALGGDALAADAWSYHPDDDTRIALLAYALPERPHLAYMRSLGRLHLDAARPALCSASEYATDEDRARMTDLVIAWDMRPEERWP